MLDRIFALSDEFKVGEDVRRVERLWLRFDVRVPEELLCELLLLLLGTTRSPRIARRSSRSARYYSGAYAVPASLLLV